MLELHIWGPAFGLPSIDAECLAAIIYLRHAFSDNNAWALVPCLNLNSNPFQRLPALRDGATWTAGFDNIIKHLAKLSNGAWDIDRTLTDAQAASCDAYSSFLISRGLPLLDLSLYVSSDNYTTCTRSALGDLLTWPQSWTLPHQMRDRAKRRSEHLGLSALDVDAAQEEDAKDSGLMAHIPKSLRKPKQTVSGLLGRNTHKTRFRLDAVIEDFLEPLQSKLAGKNWLVAEEMSSVDCLAIAILSLMQTPELPQAWLRQALEQKYSALSEWATTQSHRVYGEPTSVMSVMKGETIESILPWTAPSPLSWKETSTLTIETIVSHFPILRFGYECHEVPKRLKGAKHETDQKQELYARMRERQRLYSQAVIAFIGVASVLGWSLHTGFVSLPRARDVRPARRNFGAAGVLLGLS